MHVLAIGSDRSIFRPGSASARRQAMYGAHFDALDIIVFSRTSNRLKEATVAPGVHAHATNSSARLFYGVGAFLIALRLPRPDVVTVQDPFEAGLIGLLIARVRGVPLHVQVHTDFLSPEFARLSLLNRVRVRIAKLVVQRAARIRVVSPRIKDSIVSAYHPRAPIAILPIFVDVEKFRTARAGDLTARFIQWKTKVLVVARLEPEKNVTLALDAFAHTARHDVCLIIVGEGGERAMLEARARDLGIETQVFFEGFQDAAPYYCLANLVLVPSRFEGYGLVIVEALAAGKPVLATDVGVAREAGATIASPEQYSTALKEWFDDGVREGLLRNYPYASFADFARAYADDIHACAEGT